jgi:predicted RNA-binding protein with TRAM domain
MAEGEAMLEVAVETSKGVQLSQNQDTTSRQGDGIARVQGFVLFVKNGKVGQKTKVKVVDVADRFAKAIIVD